MSRHALTSSAVDLLADKLGLTVKDVARTPDGAPRPLAGEVFIAVHGGARTNKGETCFDEYYEIKVTVTVRAHPPYDRIEETAGEQMEEWTDKVRVLLHKSEDWRNAANAIIGTSNNGFVESAVFLGDEDSRWVGPEWFKAKPESGSRNIGLAQTLRFGRLRRIQTLDRDTAS